MVLLSKETFNKILAKVKYTKLIQWIRLTLCYKSYGCESSRQLKACVYEFHRLGKEKSRNGYTCDSYSLWTFRFLKLHLYNVCKRFIKEQIKIEGRRI